MSRWCCRCLAQHCGMPSCEWLLRMEEQVIMVGHPMLKSYRLLQMPSGRDQQTLILTILAAERTGWMGFRAGPVASSFPGRMDVLMTSHQRAVHRRCPWFKLGGL